VDLGGRGVRGVFWRNLHFVFALMSPPAPQPSFAFFKAFLACASPFLVGRGKPNPRGSLTRLARVSTVRWASCCKKWRGVCFLGNPPPCFRAFSGGRFPPAGTGDRQARAQVTSLYSLDGVCRPFFQVGGLLLHGSCIPPLLFADFEFDFIAERCFVVLASILGWERRGVPLLGPFRTFHLRASKIG